MVAPFLKTRSEAGEIVKDSTTIKEQEQHWEVEGIIDHKKEGNSWKYLVNWSGWGPEYNSWVSEKDFDDLDVIKKYWRRVQQKSGIRARLQKRQKAAKNLEKG